MFLPVVLLIMTLHECSNRWTGVMEEKPVHPFTDFMSVERCIPLLNLTAHHQKTHASVAV